MKISKLTLVITNILIAIAIVGLISQVGLNLFGKSNLLGTHNEQLDGVKSKSAIVWYSFRSFDLDYWFIYTDGETIIDEHLISPKNLRLDYKFSNALPDYFIGAMVDGKSYNMPLKTGRVYLPIDESKILRYQYTGVGLLVFLLAVKIIILFWVRRLIINFSRGEFFKKLNYQLLYRMGVLLIVAPLVLFICDNILLSDFRNIAVTLPEGYSIRVNGIGFNWNYIYASLLLLITAQAFRQGVQLQEDKDLTI